MSKKLLLTGQPKAGKSTLIHKLIEEHSDRCYGFYTREMREDDVRVGFEIVTINIPIEGGILSHVNLKAEHVFGKYNIDTSTLDRVTHYLSCNPDKNRLLIIDEISPMTAFSEHTKEFVRNSLDSTQSVLAAVKMDSSPWSDSIKEIYKNKIPLKVLTIENRDNLFKEVCAYYFS